MEKFNKDISVIFPAYNEQENIEICIIVANAILKGLVRDFEIIVVDDGSTDNTKKICLDLEKRIENFRFMSKDRNYGYGCALRDGFKVARYDLLFFSDSDRQFDIVNLQDLLKYINEYDIVIGFRKKRQDSLKRKFLSKGYNLLVGFLFGLDIKDIDCAFKLFRKSVFNEIEINSERFFFNTEILAKALARGFSIKEVGVSHFPRYDGESKVGFCDIPRTLREIIRIYRLLRIEQGKK